MILLPVAVCVCKCYFPASQGKALICRMVSSETFWTRWSLICLWNLSNKHLCICSIAIIMFMWSMNPINCQTSPEHHVGAKCKQIWYGVAISRWVAIHIFPPKKYCNPKSHLWSTAPCIVQPWNLCPWARTWNCAQDWICGNCKIGAAPASGGPPYRGPPLFQLGFYQPGYQSSESI